MKILYMSHILSIHDFRFLDKLSSSKHEVLLVSIDRNDVPNYISNLDGIKILTIPRPVPRFNFRYFLSFESILLAIKHIIYRMIQNFQFFKNYFNDQTKFLHQEFRFLHYKNQLSKIIKTFKPDIIHAGWVQLDGIIAALTGFKPILQMPWGSDILINPLKSDRNLNQTRFVLNKVEYITCDCDEVKKTILDLVDFNSDKIIVVPWGIDLKLFNPHRTNHDLANNLGWQDKRIIIVTRSLSAIYGIDYFIMALPKIIEVEPNARVLFVGTGPDEKKIKEIIDSLDLNDFVHFTGAIPNEQLAYYLNSADIYVSTSKSDGSSLSLLEAMACGLPLIVSDVPAILEWVKDGENGYVVPRKKVKPISDKVLLLLKDQDSAKKMGELNLKIANEKADWDKNYLIVESIYHKMTVSIN